MDARTKAPRLGARQIMREHRASGAVITPAHNGPPRGERRRLLKTARRRAAAKPRARAGRS